MYAYGLEIRIRGRKGERDDGRAIVPVRGVQRGGPAASVGDGRLRHRGFRGGALRVCFV